MNIKCCNKSDDRLISMAGVKRNVSMEWRSISLSFEGVGLELDKLLDTVLNPIRGA